MGGVICDPFSSFATYLDNSAALNTSQQTHRRILSNQNGAIYYPQNH